MCWNREVSLITGTTATGLSLYLLITGKGNDIPVALVSLAIALMQFAEALMWEQNPLGGHLGLIALFVQPLFLALGIVWARGFPLWSALTVLIVWVLFGLPTLYRLLQHTEWPAEPGCGGHLRWSFLDPMLASPFAPIYWITMLGGWLLFKPFHEGLEYTLTAVGTLLITQMFFPGEWGSLWCFLANALPIGRLFTPLSFL